VLFWGGEVPSQLVDLVKLSAQNGGPGVVESFFEAAAASMLKSVRLRDLEKQNTNLQNMLIFSEKYTKVITHNHSQAATMLQRHIDHLTTHLVDARSRPLEQLNRLVAGRVLRKLAKASPPLPKKTVTRFAGSAKKRDPARAEILSQQPSQAYDDIVEAWARQRAEMADRNEGLVKRLQNKVLFSVIVSVHNPNPDFLQKMISSVKEQSYVNWQLCIADDAFHDQRIREILQAAADADPRIEIVLRDANVYMSHASNSAIERAKGDYIVFLDHEDVLDPDALLYVAECIDRKPDAKIIYTDEDRIREDGTRYEPHFKPDWNREMLYSYNYISHLTTYTSDIIKRIGGFRPGYEGAQDYDLLLRCLPHVKDAQIQHIPKVLYSWRSSPASIEHTADAKPYAWEAGVRAVTEALSQSCNTPMTVELGPYPFTYIPQWPLSKEPSVSIIIPTRDRLDITRVTVETILEKTDYKNYDIIIIDNGSTEPETLAWFADISKSMRVSILRDDGPFNYSALNNRAVAQSKGEIIALVNNDIEIISAGWLREMVSLAVRPSIGCVGAKLYYPDNTIQHAGVVVGLDGAAGHSLKGLFREDPGYFMRVVLRQEYTAVTGACLVIRRNIFEEVGGLNEEHLTVGFNDVDFCLKVHAAGYRNLWTPLAEMYHHESASRKADDTPEKIARAKREVQYMVDTWHTDTYEDTAYNPNLTKLFEDFRFGPARWEYGPSASSE
jgi:O-antigen biosynthesis protein